MGGGGTKLYTISISYILKYIRFEVSMGRKKTHCTVMPYHEFSLQTILYSEQKKMTILHIDAPFSTVGYTSLNIRIIVQCNFSYPGTLGLEGVRNSDLSISQNTVLNSTAYIGKGHSQTSSTYKQTALNSKMRFNILEECMLISKASHWQCLYRMEYQVKGAEVCLTTSEYGTI